MMLLISARTSVADGGSYTPAAGVRFPPRTFYFFKYKQRNMIKHYNWSCREREFLDIEDLRDINNAIDRVNRNVIRFLVAWKRGDNCLQVFPAEIIENILKYVSLPPYMSVARKGPRAAKYCKGIVATRSYMESLFAKKTTHEREKDRKKKIERKNNKMIARMENNKQKWKFK